MVGYDPDIGKALMQKQDGGGDVLADRGPPFFKDKSATVPHKSAVLWQKDFFIVVSSDLIGPFLIQVNPCALSRQKL